MDKQSQSHPCVWSGCSNTVAYDDEPYCFTHSSDSGSYVKGYSYHAAMRRKVERQREVEEPRPWGKPF